MENGVRIIECLSKSDPGSEGACLGHVFDLMKVKSEYLRVTSIDEMLDRIEDSPFKYIHLSTHGVVNEDTDLFVGLWTPKGTGTRKKVARLDGKVQCTAIISTACKSGVKSFGNHVVNKWGSKYFIGPSREPRFHNAILFSHLFYYKLFVTQDSRGSVKKAFNAYYDSFRNPHDFRFFAKSS